MVCSQTGLEPEPDQTKAKIFSWLIQGQESDKRALGSNAGALWSWEYFLSATNKIVSSYGSSLFLASLTTIVSEWPKNYFAYYMKCCRLPKSGFLTIYSPGTILSHINK